MTPQQIRHGPMRGFALGNMVGSFPVAAVALAGLDPVWTPIFLLLAAFMFWGGLAVAQNVRILWTEWTLNFGICVWRHDGKWQFRCKDNVLVFLQIWHPYRRGVIFNIPSGDVGWVVR